MPGFEPIFSPAFLHSKDSGYSQWTRGSVFKDGSLRSAEDAVVKVDSLENAVEVALEINGFFAYIGYLGQKVIAMTDRVRSFPLFYAVQEGRLFLGDDPYQIQEKLGGRQTDSLAFAELFLTGYVTGDATFDPRIKQVPAGEVLIAVINPVGEWQISRRAYYRFHHHDEYDLSFEELLKLGQREMDRAVARLIQVADGSMIAIPLSGGYDSRYILLTLKKLGYSQLMAFSYGLPGNDEAEVSRKVAIKLGVPWHFVPYTPEKWNYWLNSPEYAIYQKDSGKMTSVAHIQDWPAVWSLKEKGVLPEGTLFAPGHSGDYLAGKQIQGILLNKKGWNRDSVLKAIWRRHYINTSLMTALGETGLNRNGKNLLRAKVLNNINSWNVSTLNGANNAFDSEFWQEKLSKFIVNSMKVYEYWGYRWWLPFFDKELVSFWERVPLEWRKSQFLYERIVERLQELVGLEIQKKNHHVLIHRVKNIISTPLAELLLWKAYGMKKMVRNYVLGLQKAIPYTELKRYLGKGGNINSYLAALIKQQYYE